MNTQRPQCIASCGDGSNLILHPDIPKLNLPIAATTDQFSHAPTLHMYVRDPLFVTAPRLLHGGCRLFTLIEYPKSTITIASNEHITGNLIGRQRRNTRT